MMRYNLDEYIDLRDAYLKELSDYWEEFLTEIPEDLNVGCGGHPSTEELIDDLEDGYGGDYEDYR